MKNKFIPATLVILLSTIHGEIFIKMDAMRTLDPQREFAECVAMVMTNEFEEELLGEFADKTGTREFEQIGDILALSFDPLEYQIVCTGIPNFEKEAELSFWTVFLNNRREILRARFDDKMRHITELVEAKNSSYRDAISDVSDEDRLEAIREAHRKESVQIIEAKRAFWRSGYHLAHWTFKRVSGDEEEHLEAVTQSDPIHFMHYPFKMTEHYQKLLGASDKQVSEFNRLSQELSEEISEYEKKSKRVQKIDGGVQVYVPTNEEYIDKLRDDFLRASREIFDRQIVEAKYTRTFLKNLKEPFWVYKKDRVISMKNYTGKRGRPGSVSFKAHWINDRGGWNTYSTTDGHKVPEEYSHLFDGIQVDSEAGKSE
ncbi:hypothetical protein DDZ13_05425 [Coraliomargarita sinensis]|uniref:Uncharacterized protein n=1 Tax=Coraliomargarita sinensis TaxID=2174842 RepID=A0A317ZG53_9BACT|nr:hypothetical protein [Coraliomargarita sinensis]PXA04614.1 hypothetical protein DDZ13_05425 [Coraliomargarita sinensis]